MAAAQTTEMMVEYERDNTIAAAADGSLHHVSTDGSESVSVSQALLEKNDVDVLRDGTTCSVQTDLPSSSSVDSGDWSIHTDKEFLFALIKKKFAPKLKFFCTLKAMKTQESIEKVVDEEGLNCAHLCVKHDRADLLSIVQACGLWAVLFDAKIQGVPEFAECNLAQYAAKNRRSRFARSIHSLGQLEESMGGKNVALKYCRSGNLDGLKNAVDQPLLNKRPLDQDENNLLHWACVSDNAEMVLYIVDELKVDPGALNKQKQTPLHVAMLYGRSNLVQVLLRRPRIDLEQTDANLKTPVQLAAENGDTESLRNLKDCSVDFEPKIVLATAKSGSKQCMQYLLEECQLDPHITDVKTGKQCLMIAAEHGHLKLVQYLVEKQSLNINEVCLQNRNSLHYSAGNGHIDVTKYLLHKASEEQQVTNLLNQKDKHKVEQSIIVILGLDKGRPAWHYIFLKRRLIHLYQACTKSRTVDASLVGIICKSGWGEQPEPQKKDEAVASFKEKHPHKDGEEDLTPLMLALTKGHKEIATTLIEAGADVHAKDCFGQTSMHLAAMRGYLDIARELSDRDVSLVAEDLDGFTPYRVAHSNRHTDMTNFLTYENQSAPLQKFREVALTESLYELSPQRREEISLSGQDVTHHVRQAVLNLQNNINVLIQNLPAPTPVIDDSTRRG